jgi:hypothetical protein
MKINAYKIKQDNISHVCDLESYLKLPKKDTLLWGLFYVHPKYVQFKSVDDFFKDGVFETEFDKHFKKNHPIQFFFRDTVPDNWNRFLCPFIRIKDKIHWWMFPRQKWLIKKIPNHWVDKDYLITEVIFESIIHFVEEEHDDFEAGIEEWEKEDETNWPTKHQYLNAHYVFRKAYRWAKLRKNVQDKLDTCSKLYPIYDKIMREYDRHFCIEILKVSDHLWR